MGRLSLFLAAAAVLGGSILTLNVQRAQQDTRRMQTEYQHDMLARNNAYDLQQKLLADMAGPEGDKMDLSGFSGGGTITERETGGWFRRDLAESTSGPMVALVAEGGSGGGPTDRASAVHRIVSIYEFVGFDIPASVILQNTLTLLDPCHRNKEGKDKKKGKKKKKKKNKDKDKNDCLNNNRAEITHEGLADAVWANLIESYSWGELIDNEQLRDDLEEELAKIDITEENANIREDLRGALETFYEERIGARLSVEGIYEAAQRTFAQKIEAGDQNVHSWDGGLTIGSGDRQEYENESLVFVRGDLEIDNGGKFAGSGVLVVEGNIDMQDANQGAEFNWDGIIVVRPPGGVDHEGRAETTLNGKVRVNGALMTNHEAVPPGGHMDVTVWGSPDGNWENPYGTEEGGASLGCGPKPGCGDKDGRGYRPWWNHSHRYDVKSGTTGMPFRQNGGAPSGGPRGRLKMDEMLDGLDDDEEYYLSFRTNGEEGVGSNDGMATYSLDIDGQSNQTGNVGDGFSDGTFRSPTFKANELNDFSVDINTLQGLAKLWNDAAQACYRNPNDSDCRMADYADDDEYDDEEHITDAPVWVGNDPHRMGALSIQVRRASDDARVYEAAAYWHKKPNDTRSAADRSLAERLAEDPEEFGFNLSLGKNAEIHHDVYNVLRAARMIGLGGSGDPFQLRRSYVQHYSPGEEKPASFAGAIPPEAGDFE